MVKIGDKVPEKKPGLFLSDCLLFWVTGERSVAYGERRNNLWNYIS